MDTETPEFPIRVGGYRIDLLFQGYPGKSAHNGGLGWSTVALLRGHDRVILIDTGAIGIRTPLLHRLKQLGLAPTDITDVLLTHSHWDHVMNYPLFTAANLYIGKVDLDWANSGAADVYAVAEPYARELAREPRLSYLEVGSEVFPGIRVEAGPGHTPGHLIFILSGEDRDVVFVQDAAKNKAEMVSRDTDLTIDSARSRATIERIWALWSARAGNILVPGHDLPMILCDGEIVFLGRRQAGVIGLLGDSPEEQTLFPLTKP
ncbi:MBL fold metallo-hydrolase [Amaricoccus solimangrovi]|uniref:MBL fold metallo-hydrolase n=1 Tax=Amaricoccus solimangrovi TaxID=2589815 RepID=A0A501WE51_9RHOB|nr:MBL fold metallo-hydrolase [Amaricoccus solimangrovi]TPE47112.1 MBL fold metallo-hydrolase [Amaricoccus solimangrovi]